MFTFWSLEKTSPFSLVQLKIYGGVPPFNSRAMEPSFAPLQEIPKPLKSVIVSVTNSAWSGSEIVKFVPSFTQPFASVMWIS